MDTVVVDHRRAKPRRRKPRARPAAKARQAPAEVDWQGKDFSLTQACDMTSVRCPVCRHPLAARMTSTGPAFPCPCTHPDEFYVGRGVPVLPYCPGNEPEGGRP